MASHPWHDIPLGRKFPAQVPAVIETPMGSNAQYVLDHNSGMLRLEEFLPTVARYPANWGFFPCTLAGDGDPLDVIVLGREPVPPLTIIEARLLGGLRIASPKKPPEHKLLAVPISDPEHRGFHGLHDIPKHVLKQLEEFFAVYKARSGDSKRVFGTYGRAAAAKVLREAAENYKKVPSHRNLPRTA